MADSSSGGTYLSASRNNACLSAKSLASHIVHKYKATSGDLNSLYSRHRSTESSQVPRVFRASHYGHHRHIAFLLHPTGGALPPTTHRRPRKQLCPQQILPKTALPSLACPNHYCKPLQTPATQPPLRSNIRRFPWCSKAEIYSPPHRPEPVKQRALPCQCWIDYMRPSAKSAAVAYRCA